MSSVLVLGEMKRVLVVLLKDYVLCRVQIFCKFISFLVNCSGFLSDFSVLLINHFILYEL